MKQVVNIRRGLCVFCMAAVLITGTGSLSAQAASSPLVTDTEAAQSADTSDRNYDAYLATYTGAQRPETSVLALGPAAQYADGEGVPRIETGIGGIQEEAVLSEEGEGLTWIVTVPQAGLYNLKLEYYPVKGASSTIERELILNGTIPFDNASHFTFHGNYENAGQEGADYVFQRDSRDNDIRPSQVEAPIWMEAAFTDYLGYTASPYLFYFQEGENTLTLSASHGDIWIRSICLYQEEELQSYAQVRERYAQEGYEIAQGEILYIQGEEARYKSDPMLYPTSDRSSPSTVPYSVSKIRLNTIGGASWKNVGQQITWEITVEESGLYRLGIKYRQNSVRGMLVHRRLKIDGKVPFAEAEDITFGYSGSWQNFELSADGEPCYLYFEKGRTYQLSLEVSVGSMAQLLDTANESLNQLNYAYRQILMIMGTQPDRYRDYQLEKQVPEALEILKEQAAILQQLTDRLYELTGKRSSSTGVVTKLAAQLQSMADKPELVQRKWSDFKSNLSAFGDWIISAQDQPLEIDYLVLLPEGKEMPQAQAGFFAQLKHEVGALAASFIEDYNSIGSVSDEDSAITVWVQTGRDQAQILKSLVDNIFTPETGISVNIQLVQGVLLQSIVAGRAPDVALNIAAGDPVNYAMRGALVDLSGFDTYSEVAQRFAPSALVPFQYQGGVYALAETQTFPMLFYRTDIFEELGLEAPQTWDDVIAMLRTLQKNNLDLGIGTDSMGTYAMLLYQYGGSLYTEDGSSSAIDSYAGIQAFETWTSFFTDYETPLTYNFVNRFRSGEMPVGIVDYSNYNTLSVFAPEIRGMWEMVPVPGVEKEDGTIDRSVAGTSTGCIMLKDCRNPQAAWEFLDWWTSADVQLEYGKELESLLGVAARYTTANLEAIASLDWSKQDYANLTLQQSWTKGNPEVPGGYYTSRHIDNAFRNTVYHDRQPRDTLLEYVKLIDAEIENKRAEFHLNG